MLWWPRCTPVAPGLPVAASLLPQPPLPLPCLPCPALPHACHALPGALSFTVTGVRSCLPAPGACAVGYRGAGLGTHELGTVLGLETPCSAITGCRCSPWWPYTLLPWHPFSMRPSSPVGQGHPAWATDSSQARSFSAPLLVGWRSQHRSPVPQGCQCLAGFAGSC